MKNLKLLILLVCASLFAHHSFAQCDMTVITSDPTDVGGGNCEYDASVTIGNDLPGGDSQNGNSIEIFIGNTSVFFTNCNPCAGQTYDFTFVAPCGSTVEVSYVYDGNGNGANTCSVMQDLSLGTLAVSLTSWNVTNTGNRNELSWSTKEEVNNAGFEILRSQDGKHFDKISFVEGAGHSNENIEYSYVDGNLKPGTYYYQLRQLDYNGVFSLSSVISITIDGFSKTLIFPNPALDQRFFIEATEAGEMHIFNHFGTSIIRAAYAEGENSFLLSNLEQGVYLVQLESESGNVYSQRLFIAQ